jgi:hypothetical protein
MMRLPLKPMPSLAEYEAQWRATDDPVLKERLWRKRQIRKIVGEGTESPMGLWIWKIGNAFLVGHHNEAYSNLQTELRTRFPDRAIAVINLVNGTIGYLPPRAMYAHNIYQVWQTPFAAGSLETVIETAASIIAAATEH